MQYFTVILLKHVKLGKRQKLRYSQINKSFQIQTTVK